MLENKQSCSGHRWQLRHGLRNRQEFIAQEVSDGASVINLSSVSSFEVAPGTAIYAASKAALNSYTGIVAIELAPQKIRVNAITPGMVATDLSAKSGMPEEAIRGMNTSFESKIPLPGFAQPEE